LSLADLRKWNARYRDGEYSTRGHPTALLARFADALKPGPALDVACGAGRNSLFLAAAGFEVDAVDIATAGLERLARDANERGLVVETCAADLERGLPAAIAGRAAYDLIVMVRYVNLPLIASLIDKLTDGGIFVSEQHLRTDLEVVGPTNPAFRLEPNALLRAAAPLRAHYYREGIVTDPDGRRAALAQIVASRGEASLFAF